MAVLKILLFVLLSFFVAVSGRSVTLQFEFEDILKLLPYLAKSDQLRSIASVFARSAKVSADLATPSKYHNPYHPEDDIIDLAETVLTNVKSQEDALSKMDTRMNNKSYTSPSNTEKHQKEDSIKENYNDNKQSLRKEEGTGFTGGISDLSATVQKLMDSARNNDKNLVISIGTPKSKAGIPEKSNNNQNQYNDAKSSRIMSQTKKYLDKTTKIKPNLHVARLKKEQKQQKRHSDLEEDNDLFVKQTALSETELVDFASDVASLSASVQKITKGSENKKNKFNIYLSTPKFTEDVPKSTAFNQPDKSPDFHKMKGLLKAGYQTEDLRQKQIDMDIEKDNDMYLKQSIIKENESSDNGNDSDLLQRSFTEPNSNHNSMENSSHHQQKAVVNLQRRFVLIGPDHTSKTNDEKLPYNAVSSYDLQTSDTKYNTSANKERPRQSTMKTYDDNTKNKKPKDYQENHNKDSPVAKNVQRRFFIKRSDRSSKTNDEKLTYNPVSSHDLQTSRTKQNTPANKERKQQSTKSYSNDNMKEEKSKIISNNDRKYAGFVVRSETAVVKPFDRPLDQAEQEINMAENIALKALEKPGNKYKLPTESVKHEQ